MRSKLFFTILLSIFAFTQNEGFCAQFSEISFKNTENDWIEIELKNPLTNSLKVQEDSLIFEIPPEAMMNKKFILIYFKALATESIEEGEILKIFVTKKGLTGTTEQLTLESAGEILDKVCWKNSKPPASETKDMENLGIECLNSEDVNKNDSIARTDNIWKITNYPTPGTQNVIKSPASKKKNGDLSQMLEITEVFPNPKGKDQGNEWLEIYNKGNKSVNLENWKINKKSIKNLVIAPNGYVSVNTTLKNTDAQIQLKDFNGKIIDQISYKEAKENFSYSKLGENWYWTNPTKNGPNPQIEIFKAQVISTPEVINGILQFTTKRNDEQNSKTETIIIENHDSKQLFQTLLKENTKIQLTVEKQGTQQKMLGLKILETPKPEKEEKNQINYFPIIALLASGFVLYYVLKK